MGTQAKNIVSSPRERVKLRIRKRVFGTEGSPRISVFKSSKHIYVQVISDSKAETLVSVSTQQPIVAKRIEELARTITGVTKSFKGTLAARVVGLVVAEKCKQLEIITGKFDRNGFRYAGRVKALADGAREGGLQF